MRLDGKTETVMVQLRERVRHCVRVRVPERKCDKITTMRSLATIPFRRWCQERGGAPSNLYLPFTAECEIMETHYSDERV